MTTGTPTGSAAWLTRYYELCETDIDGAVEYWAADGVLRFANMEPLIGREAIRAAFKRMVAMWAEERHTIVNLWELPGGIVIFEMDVHFRMHDGTEIGVRGAAVQRVENEQFLEQNIYVDLGAVWAAAEKAPAPPVLAG